MSDPSRVVVALKNALSVDVNHDDRVFVADCKHEKLQSLLGNVAVQQALINSGYTIIPSDNGFAVSHNSDSVGKLYGSDKKPKKEGDEDKKD